VPAATLRILARNVESDAFKPTAGDAFSPLRLQFSNFSIELLDQGKRPRLEYARQFFRCAMFGECLIEREFDAIPPAPDAYSGFGTLPNEAEDLLLLLRLFRPGDLSFVSLSMQKPGSQPSIQYPYRVISNLVSGFSARPFIFNRPDVMAWEAFAPLLKSAASWNATWFKVARRWFLYGGAKEFNPYIESGAVGDFDGEVDRVADYVAALEAVLLPENEMFIQRRLKKRAVRILGLADGKAMSTERLLARFYGIRSTLVHGSPLSNDDLLYLRDRQRWREFEELVRDLLVAAVRKVPAEEPARASYLAGLYEPSDAERAEDFAKNFKTIKDPLARLDLIGKLREL
jgi:hypothetical protein